MSQSTPVLTVGEKKVSLCGITVTNKKEAIAFLSEFTDQEVVVEKNDIWVKAKINGAVGEESITALLIVKKLATVTRTERSRSEDADKCSESHQLMLYHFYKIMLQ